MKGFSKQSAVAYLLLSTVYLLYWNHVDFFVDDWILLPLFRRALEEGPSGVIELVDSAIRNRIYGVFRTQWLSILWGFVVTALGGFSIKFNYLVLLLLHTANAWLFCQALWRLEAGAGLAFLAGAVFLLAPTTHWVLFTYFTNPFYVFSTFWVLLMLWYWAGRVAENSARWKHGLVLACMAVLGLFSGEQVFVLLWAVLPLALLLLTPRSRRKTGIKAIAPVWCALAAAGGVYLFWVSEASIRQVGSAKRYEWQWPTFKNNVELIWEQMPRFTGLGDDPFYRLAPQTMDVLLALATAGIVGAMVWISNRGDKARPVTRRVFAFAAAGLMVGYAPTLWLIGGYALRYHYVPAPFLALAIAAALAGFRRRLLPALAGGLVAGFFTLTLAANLRQGWIPQADHQRLLVASLRNLKGLDPGDILVIQGTPFEIGTAQHFSMHSPEAAGPFVEWLTGVKVEEVDRQLMNKQGNWSLYQKASHDRHVPESALRRTIVLVHSHGTFSRPQWAAEEFSPGRFHLSPLKGTPTGGWPRDAVFSREQLAMMGLSIYVALPYPFG